MNKGRFWIMLLLTLYFSITTFLIFGYWIIKINVNSEFVESLMFLSLTVFILLIIFIVHKIKIRKAKNTGNFSIKKSYNLSLILSSVPFLIIGILISFTISLISIVKNTDLGVNEKLILGFKINNTDEEVQYIICKLLSEKIISKKGLDFNYHFSGKKIEHISWDFNPTFHNERLKGLYFRYYPDSLRDVSNFDFDLKEYLYSEFGLTPLNKLSNEDYLVRDDLLFIINSGSGLSYSIIVTSRELYFLLYEKQPNAIYKGNESGDTWSWLHWKEFENILPMERLKKYGC